MNCTATQTWSTHSISSLAHERRVRVDLRTVATETFSIELREATVRGVATKTAGTGMQLSCIGEQLPCTREPGTRKDPFAVAVVRSSVTVSRTIDCITSARTTVVADYFAWQKFRGLATQRDTQIFRGGKFSLITSCEKYISARS